MYTMINDPFICYRLVEDEERMWTDQNIDAIAMKHFPNITKKEALGRPILFSNWLSKDYIPVDQEELRDYVKARLKVWHFLETLVQGLDMWHQVYKPLCTIYFGGEKG